MRVEVDRRPASPWLRRPRSGAVPQSRRHPNQGPLACARLANLRGPPHRGRGRGTCDRCAVPGGRRGGCPDHYSHVAARGRRAAGAPDHLVIDENPSPVAATFALGPDVAWTASRRACASIYTNIHAVAELSDGKLCVDRAVREGGGRLLRAGAEADGGRDSAGYMRLREFPHPSSSPPEAKPS